MPPTQTPPAPAATAKPPPADSAPTSASTTPSGDTSRRRIWVSLAVGAAGAAILLPALAALFGPCEREEREEERKETRVSGGQLLEKLVGWVKDVTDGESEGDGEDGGDVEVDADARAGGEDYVALADAGGFVKTQGL